MNAPIQALYATANNLYAVLISPIDGKVYNTTLPGYETYNSAHWGAYAVPLTEYAGSGYYRAAYPVASPTFLSTDIIFVQNGGSPTLGDPPATSIYQSQGVNIAAAGNSWTAGQNMALAVGTQQTGSINGTPSSLVLLPTNLVSTQIGTYAGRTLIMISGQFIQEASLITQYDGAGNLTIVGLPSGGTPASGDLFIII